MSSPPREVVDVSRTTTSSTIAVDRQPAVATSLVLGLIATLAIIVLRCPPLLTAPRFWAEEGQIYFASAWNRGFWTSLGATQLGYYALVPNVAAAVATLVPLERAPFVTTAFALGVQLLPSAVVLTGTSWMWSTLNRRLVIAVAIQLLSPFETWLTTIAAQFWLCVVAFLILEDTGDGGGVRRWSHRILLALGGLTGVTSCFLTPFFVWKARNAHRREAWVQVGILCATSVVQFAALTTSVFARDPALVSRFAVNEFSFVWLLITHFLEPILGAEFLLWPGWETWNASFAASLQARFGLAAAAWPPLNVLLGFAVAVVPCAVLFASGLRRDDERRVWLAFVWVVGLSTAASIRFASSPRYAFVPTVMLFALLLAQWQPHGARWRRRLAMLMLSITVATSVIGYRSRVYYSDTLPRWPEEVRVWRAYPLYQPRIWPQFEFARWRVALRPR